MLESTIEAIRGRDRSKTVSFENMFNQIHSSSQVIARGAASYDDGEIRFDNDGDPRVVLRVPLVGHARMSETAAAGIPLATLERRERTLVAGDDRGTGRAELGGAGAGTIGPRRHAARRSRPPRHRVRIARLRAGLGHVAGHDRGDDAADRHAVDPAVRWDDPTTRPGHFLDLFHVVVRAGLPRGLGASTPWGRR